MASIFDLDKFQDSSTRIDMDELYEKKQQHDKQELDTFNAILAKIHVRIKSISRQNINQQYIWYVVPEKIFGFTRFNQASCIAYVVDQLKTNGFSVRYIHPNTLYICWQHWIPSYIRNEIKKKTGIEVDEFGKVIKDKNKQTEEQEENPLMGLMNRTNEGSGKNKNRGGQKASDRNYTPINSYKPTGNLIYDDL